MWAQTQHHQPSVLRIKYGDRLLEVGEVVQALGRAQDLEMHRGVVRDRAVAAKTLIEFQVSGECVGRHGFRMERRGT